MVGAPSDHAAKQRGWLSQPGNRPLFCFAEGVRSDIDNTKEEAPAAATVEARS